MTRYLLNRWAVLPLTISGRIESIRMNVLPGLLFLFQALPPTPPKNMFTILDCLISRFIWQGRCPRVRYKTLQLSKQQGEWGLPHLRHYWLACQLRALTIWISDKRDTGWLEIEKSLCTLTPLSNVHSLKIKPWKRPWVDGPKLHCQHGERCRGLLASLVMCQFCRVLLILKVLYP